MYIYIPRDLHRHSSSTGGLPARFLGSIHCQSDTIGTRGLFRISCFGGPYSRDKLCTGMWRLKYEHTSLDGCGSRQKGTASRSSKRESREGLPCCVFESNDTRTDSANPIALKSSSSHNSERAEQNVSKWGDWKVAPLATTIKSHQPRYNNAINTTGPTIRFRLSAGVL